MKNLQAITTLLDAINEWTGRAVAWLTLMMVLITFTVVVLRYLFDLGWIAMQEIITYLHAAVFMLAAGYTLKHDAHVRVDILYHPAGPRAKAWIDLLGALLLLLPVSLFLFWISWDYVMVSWSMREGSPEAGGLGGVWILKTVIPVMAILIIFQGISQILHAVTALMSTDTGYRQPIRDHN